MQPDEIGVRGAGHDDRRVTSRSNAGARSRAKVAGCALRRKQQSLCVRPCLTCLRMCRVWGWWWWVETYHFVAGEIADGCMSAVSVFVDAFVAALCVSACAPRLLRKRTRRKHSTISPNENNDDRGLRRSRSACRGRGRGKTAGAEKRRTSFPCTCECSRTLLVTTGACSGRKGRLTSPFARCYC